MIMNDDYEIDSLFTVQPEKNKKSSSTFQQHVIQRSVSLSCFNVSQKEARTNLAMSFVSVVYRSMAEKLISISQHYHAASADSIV